MPLPLRFKLLSYHDTGLKNAPQILRRNLKGSLEGLGKRLRTSAWARMREDRGVEKKSLRIIVRGQGLDLRMEVTTKLVQAFVDAYGIPRGKIFPPFRRGTPLHAWAKRKAAGIQSKQIPGVSKGERELSHINSRRPRKKAKRKSRVSKTGNVPVTTGQRNKAKNNDADRIAFLAARSIFEKGIRPTHWNTKALDANRNRIVQDLKNALSRSVNEINRS